MCNSWAFCIYQTFLKNLTDNRINQIKKLIKLILRSVSCHVMVLSCNNGKKIMITNMITRSSTNIFKGGLRDRPNMPKRWISLKPLALAQNSSNIKKNPDLNTCEDSATSYYLVLALLQVNLFQPLVAGNVDCSEKYRFLEFKYLKMIT